MNAPFNTRFQVAFEIDRNRAIKPGDFERLAMGTITAIRCLEQANLPDEQKNDIIAALMQRQRLHAQIEALQNLAVTESSFVASSAEQLRMEHCECFNRLRGQIGIQILDLARQHDTYVERLGNYASLIENRTR